MTDLIITSVDATILDIPLRRPHRFSILTIDRQSVVLVRVFTRAGPVGIGEGVVPGGPWWGGESVEGIKELIDRHLAPLLTGQDASRVRYLSALMDRMISGAPFAKAAVEMALWDISGKAAGLPVYRLLGGLHRDRLPVTWALGADSADTVVAEARDKLDRHLHRSFKLKMGAGEPPDDVSRVTEIAARLTGAASLAVDLNGTWDEPTAKRWLPELTAAGITLAEQPVPGWNTAALGRLTEKLTISVMADESLRTVHDGAQLAAAHAADIFAVKLAKSGGICNVQTIGAIAAAYGIPCYGGTTIETSIGTAAAAHAFCSMPALTAGTELFGPMLLTDDIVKRPVRYSEGHLYLPQGPGLGVELDEDRVAKYARG
jgi:muconate cycloisomerase